MNSQQLQSGPVSPVKKHIPGEAGIWVFILGDMLVFALFFAVYTFYFVREHALFIASQATLSATFGLINTFLLLTSSWFVALAVNGAKLGVGRKSANFFALAFLCGLGFSVLKIIEYSNKGAAGISLLTNDFYMYYFILTGIHFAHVIIGMVLLGFLFFTARKGATGPRDLVFIEIGASYWHMVDLLWIVLFCLIYLLK